MSTTFTHEIPGGAAWSLVLRRRRTLTLTTSGDGSANAAMLVFAAEDPLDRLNVPDTLKAQMSACVRPPMVLMSDMGRALCSVTGSSVPWHDAVTGTGADPGLLDELWKHGLDRRDLHATVNWFTKVVPGDDDRGTLSYVPGRGVAGDWVELRAEQDVLIVVSTALHPMNPDRDAKPAGVLAAVGLTEAPGVDDPSRLFRDESARALAMTERTAP